MFKRIVIGVEECESGRDAIELARRLAAPGAELILVCVYPSTAGPWYGASSIYEAAMLQHAEDVLAHLRRETPVDVTLRPIASASTGRGLHMAAEQAGADLLVVGSSRHGMLERVLLGDATKDALNGAPCPVLIAPAGYARHGQPIRRIGVGYNGSPESEHALALARRLAGSLKADLSALHAVEVPAYTFMGASGMLSVDFIGDMVSSAFNQVSRLPGVEPHAVYGQAAEELAHYSESVDLLVVGSRGYGPVGRLVHGSTTSGLAATSHCPLLVLTRAGERGNADADREDDAAFHPQSAWVRDTASSSPVRASSPVR